MNTLRLSARVTPARVLEGNDVTEYHQANGDVRAWVMTVMGDDARFPLRVVIPAGEADQGIFASAGCAHQAYRSKSGVGGTALCFT